MSDEKKSTETVVSQIKRITIDERHVLPYNSVKAKEIKASLARMFEKIYRTQNFYIEILEDFLKNVDGIDPDELDIGDKQFIESVRNFLKNYYDSNAKNDTFPSDEDTSLMVSIGAHRVDTIGYPIDKPNSVIWNLLKENTHGQLTFPIKAESYKSKCKIDIIYSIDFDGINNELSITKKLTQFDKRVYIATAALWNAGNSIITISQIYRSMGYKTDTPGKTDREKIDKSLTKMRGAMIVLNNRQEIEAGYNYPLFIYDGALLPFERVKKQDVINGQLIESSIHLFREPPLISFARERKQVTTIPLKLLQSPPSKTDVNLAIEDYLLERIAHAKTGSRPKKILLSTIYNKANITSSKQRSRTPAKIKQYLDYYMECDAIKGYTMDKTSVTLQL